MTISDEIFSFVSALRAKLLGGGGLKGHLFRGGTWLGIGSMFEQVFRLGRNMLLTRLLAPEAFGIMAIVYSTSSVVDMLADIGVRDAVVQNPNGTDQRYINSAWWLAFCRGLVIYSMLFVGAPWVGRFYGHADLVPLMRIALLGIIFSGAQSPKAYVALKEMKFRQWTIIQSGSGICGSIAVVMLAFLVKSVWALALGYAAECLIRCIVSYVICPFRPKLELDRESVRSLIRFSRGVFGLSFLYLIFNRADIFVLGKVVPAAELGVYTMAVYLVQVPSSFIAGVLRQTLMPGFAQIQEDHPRINRIVARSTSTVIALGMPALVFVVLSSRGLLSLLYGPRYIAGSAPLVVAAVAAIANLANNLLTVVFYATGRPELHRRCVFIMALLMAILVYPAVLYFGLVGGQLAALAAIVAGYVSQIGRMERYTQLDLRQYSKSFPFALAVSCGVLAIFLGVRRLLIAEGPVTNLAVGMSGCILALLICGRTLLRQSAAEV